MSDRKRVEIPETSPLRDRFGWSARLDYYPVDDLEEIVTRSGGLFAFVQPLPKANGEGWA